MNTFEQPTKNESRFFCVFSLQTNEKELLYIIAIHAVP